MSTPARAPDGKPWPVPRVGVDTSEQNPLAFGHVPAAWEADAPVHHGQIDADKCDPKHHIFGLLARRARMPYPWRCERANLGEGDYQLLDPRTSLPIPHLATIETKRGDLVSSYIAEHDRLEEEFIRMRPYRFRAVVAMYSMERLVGKSTEAQPRGAIANEASLIGSILALSWDHRVPAHLMPTAEHAEYIVAFLLARAWRVALIEDGSLLAAVRLEEARDAAHARPEPKALPSPPMRNRSGISAPPPPVEGLQPDPRASPRIRHPGIPGSPRPSWSRERA